MTTKIKPLTYIIIFIHLLTLLTGCSSNNSEEQTISQTSFLFNTVITIQLYDCEDEDILTEAFQLCTEYEGKFSRTIETSEISQINSASGSPVTVSDDTIELINLGLYYSELSNGSFDITIAPLSSLWDFTNNDGVIPSDEDIAASLAHINYETVSIEGNTVTLEDPEAMIDLGGIAKGYIADKLKEFLLSQNVEHAIINLGGNVLTVGSKTDGSNFIVGIQEPFADTNEAITSVSISDLSLVSSGIYERYFELDGVIYHHILDPSTGYPYENDLYSVSIISDTSVAGDALSTICMTMGLEEGIHFIESLDGIDAIFVTNELELYQTTSY